MLLDEPADLMAEVHAAVLAAADEPLRSEPTLAAEVAASTRANVLHWAASMVRDPGGRVPANLTPRRAWTCLSLDNAPPPVRGSGGGDPGHQPRRGAAGCDDPGGVFAAGNFKPAYLEPIQKFTHWDSW